MKPTLHSIQTFDALRGTSVYFTYTGSKQIASNELTITNVATSLVVYKFTNQNYEKVHHIPPAILENGKTYKAELRVTHSDDTVSDFSNAVQFYTVSTPILDIVSIDGQGYIYNTDVTFVANYRQNEDDIIARYRFSLYDENNYLLKNYPMRYNDSKEVLQSVSETVSDLKKGKGYYIEVSIETEKGMFHSQKERFIPMYVTPAVKGIIEAENDEEFGFVKVNSRLKQLLGTAITATEYYNYKYVDKDWVVVPNEAPILYRGLGMNRASDFIMKVWLYDVPFGDMFLSLTQEDGLISIDFYRLKDRVIAKKYIDGVGAVYTSNILNVAQNEKIFMFVKVVEHRIEIIIEQDIIQ